MKYRITFLLILLMFVVLISVFLLKGRYFLNALQGEILAYLEETYQVKLVVGRIDPWPINQLLLEDVQVLTSNANFSLITPRIKIYYDFWALLRQKPFSSSIKQLELLQPELKIKLLDGQEGTSTAFLPQLAQAVYPALSIEGGKLVIIGNQTQLVLEDTKLSILPTEQQGLRINLASSLTLAELQWQGVDLPQQSLQDLDLELWLNSNKWQGSLSVAYFDLQKLNQLLGFLPFQELTLEEMKGQGALTINFSGQARELLAYQGIINLKDTVARFSYKDLDKQEIRDLKGKLLFNSEEQELFLEDFSFTYQDNPFQYNGSINLATGSLFGHLSSSKLNLASFLSEHRPKLDLEGLAQAELFIEGSWSEPELSLDLAMPWARWGEENIENLKLLLRYRQELFYLDFLTFNHQREGLVSLQGVYNQKSQEYSLDFTGHNLNLAALLAYYSEPLLPSQDLKGRFNLQMGISGKGLDLEDLNLSGKLEFTSLEYQGQSFDQLQTDFWLTHGLILLQEGFWQQGGKQLQFAGKIDLWDKDLNLEITGKNFTPAFFSQFTGKELPLTGSFDFQGTISDKITNPQVEMEVKMAAGTYQNYNFTDLESHLLYQDKKISFTGLQLRSKEVDIQGQGSVDLGGKDPFLEGEVQLQGISFEYLSQLTDYSLPLTGTLDAVLQIKGVWPEPVVKGVVSSADTRIAFSENNLKVDQVSLDFNWQPKEEFLLEQLVLNLGKGQLMIKGQITQEQQLDLSYQIKDLSFSDLKIMDQLTGLLSSQGQVKGDFSQPELSGILKLQGFKYQNIEVETMAGTYYLQDEIFHLANLDWQINDHAYTLDGSWDLVRNELDLSLQTAKGSLMDYPALAAKLPLPDNYYLTGQLDFKGNFAEPYSLLDLTFFNEADDSSWFSLKGKVGQEINLTILGHQLNIRDIDLFSLEDIQLAGLMDFQGQVTGSPADYRLSLTTELQQGQVNQFTVKSLAGSLEYSSQGFLYLDQQLDFQQGEGLQLKGCLPLQPGSQELDLTFDVTELPLSFLSSLFTALPEMDGQVRGVLTLQGNLAKPVLTGKLFLEEGYLDFNFPAKFKQLSGILVFKEDRIELPEIAGYYGDGPISLWGKIYPFNPENIWDLSLEGQNLPFNYGSFNGRFDSEMSIKGSLLAPLIKSDLLVHDFVIGLPIAWPQQEKGTFNPRFQLNLKPGENIYIRHKNMEILVQEGSLVISNLNEDGIQLEGRLSSEQGSFDYYNNKFILSQGEVSFQKYFGYIPEVKATAWTQVQGTRIEVNVHGPANQMITTFSSQPPLSEEDILLLLTSKGGLGEFISGNYENILTKEIARFFADYIQADLVDNLEEKLKNIFSLDRLEIDTYNLGWEQEITLYLGKYLNEQIYLQYTGIIQPEGREKELAFRYLLDDSIVLEGSWRGQDDYRFSIETNFEF